MPNDVLLLLGDNGDCRCTTAEIEFRSLLGESGAESSRCRTLVAGGGVTERSTNSSPWWLSRSVSDPDGVVSFNPYVEGDPWETIRGRDPPDNLEEFDVDDVVEDVDEGIGDRADRPNAGEGEFNRIPLSFSSACSGEGWEISANSSTIHKKKFSPLDSSSPNSSLCPTPKRYCSKMQKRLM